MKQHILDYWADSLGILISDLHAPAYRAQLLLAIEQTPEERFPPPMWAEAADYLIAGPASGAVDPVDKRMLLQWLRDPAR